MQATHSLTKAFTLEVDITDLTGTKSTVRILLSPLNVAQNPLLPHSQAPEIIQQKIFLLNCATHAMDMHRCLQKRWKHESDSLTEHLLQELYLPVVVDVSLLHPSFGPQWERVLPNFLHYPRHNMTVSSGFLLAFRWETYPVLRVSAENLCIQTLKQEEPDLPALPLSLPR